SDRETSSFASHPTSIQVLHQAIGSWLPPVVGSKRVLYHSWQNRVDRSTERRAELLFKRENRVPLAERERVEAVTQRHVHESFLDEAWTGRQRESVTELHEAVVGGVLRAIEIVLNEIALFPRTIPIA